MFDLNPDVRSALADPDVHPALRDEVPAIGTMAVADGSSVATRVRAAIGRRLIALGAALLPDEPLRRPVARP